MKKGFIAVLVILAVAIVGLFLGLERVQAGYEGVVYNASGCIEAKTLKQGWHLIAPWKTVTQYPVSRETIMFSAENNEGEKGDTSIAIGSKEGKYLKVNVTTIARCDVAKLPELFTMFKGQSFEVLREGIIKQTIKAELTKVSTEYPMFDIYSGKRGEVSAKAQVAIAKKLEQIGIIVESVEITGVTLDAETQRAVDALQKAKMEQKQVEANAKAQQAKAEAEVAVAKAEAEKAKAQAEVSVAQAEGQAKAKVAQAEGEAKANAVLSNSLTPTLMQLKLAEIQADVQKAYADAWKNGGHMPSTIFNGNGSNNLPIMPFQLPTVTK